MWNWIERFRHRSLAVENRKRIERLRHQGCGSAKAAFSLRQTYPDLQVFAPITVGDDTIIGLNAIVLPGTVIGSGCLINAGAVVRGTIPDDSAVGGDPAQVHGKVSQMLASLPRDPGRLDVYSLAPEERRDRIERHFGL